MNITMDLSEILLYLELMKKEKKKPSLEELIMMISFLEDYDQVKEFNNKLDELKFKLPNKFTSEILIHFIEDYEECIKIRNIGLQDRRQKHGKSRLFIHQIFLSKSREQAISIINEAKDYDISIGEGWADRFDSMWIIKRDQETMRKSIRSDRNYPFSEMYEKFCEMKLKYFNNLSLKQLKKDLLEQQSRDENTRKTTQISVFSRSVYIKEFARRVANGICQLCDKEAPFLGKEGNPFLEVHHIHYLSKGGSDAIDNVVALCPNCHKKIHHLELEEDVKKLSNKALENFQ